MESIETKVSVHEEKIKVINKRIDDLEDKTEDLPRIDTLMEMVVKTNERQTVAIEKLNENITELNNGYKEIKDGHTQLNARLGSLETDIQDARDNSKVDILKLSKHVIFTVAALVIGAIIMKVIGL